MQEPSYADRPFPQGMVAECNSPRETRRPSVPTRDLMTLAEGIAAQVAATVPCGPQRCMLRQMVEMFLDGADRADR